MQGVDRDGERGDDPERQVNAPVDERRSRAVTLYLQGRRVVDIAADLCVSETTVRRWVRHTLETLAADERNERIALAQGAIESQRAVASAAWEAYEHERQLDDAISRGELDHVRRRAIRGHRLAPSTHAAEPATRDDDDCPPLAMEDYERPKRSAQGARYLAVALAAQREVARLQGLYARLAPSERDVQITISRRPDGPENSAPPTPADTKERDDG